LRGEQRFPPRKSVLRVPISDATIRYGQGAREGRRMKLKGTVALALLAFPAVAVTPADAASTRAEYIAQVDPICQSYKGPELADAEVFRRNHKLWVRAATKGTVKEFARQTHRLAQSLFAWDRLHSTMTEQIAAIPPVPADAAVIDTWLNDRRQSDAFAD